MENSLKTKLSTKLFHPFFLILSFFILACQTHSEHHFIPLAYTELDARNGEIDEIRLQIEEKPLESLWRSALLLETLEGFPNEHKDACEAVFDEAKSFVLRETQTALDEKNIPLAKAFVLSLQNLSVTEIALYTNELERLENDFLKTYFPALGLDENNHALKDSKNSDNAYSEPFPSLPPSKVSQYLQGLVTVWVDRGVSVQRGLGLPDRIIGSGFFIDSMGHMITNYHVIESEVDTTYKGYSRVYVKLYDDVETRYPAKVIGYDKALDLALLKTEVPVPFSFSLGSSEDLEVGDRIFAMGSPLGLENTITSGIVSSKSRSLSTVASAMQIDAAINPGNSGGPIVDQNGLVQAIVFAGVLEYEGLNFAIPVEQLEKILVLLFHGEVKHSYTGFYAKTKRELPQQEALGIEVHYVMRGSAAQKGLLAKGDIVQSLNATKIRTVEDYQNAMLEIMPGTIIKLGGVNQEGEAFTKYLYTEERPEMPIYEAYKREPVEDFFLPSFGMKLKRTSVYNKNQYEIASIIKGSAADENGFSLQDPVEIKKIKFLEKNTIVYAELFTRKRNKAYFEVNLAIGASLDSPYFF